MIVVTGAAGFIGSCTISKLNREGFYNIVAVDDFSREDKNANLNNKKIQERVHRDDFFDFFEQNGRFIEFVFHLGARTDTAEFDCEIFDRLNLNYSKKVWQKCTEYSVPLLYASSAATYGLGEHGYMDDHNIVNQLKPLNPYGDSKNDFDKWVLTRETTPPFWTGIKFFNVFGPGEFHKSRMASVVMHTYNQIVETGKMKLFKSHRDDIAHGEQKRDFIYIKDAVNVLYFHMLNRRKSGIYNLGTGEARTFYDLAASVFKALGRKPEIEFIPTPEDIRDKYQYFTEAEMQKTRSKGYDKPFTPLESAVDDYVNNYLKERNYY